MWSFLQQGSLDGVWYWDLENPDEEWMSPEFWQLFGIDPSTKKHDPTEWQDIIFAEDLAVALENFEKHCEDPSHPYDQMVRYRHSNGSTIWVRCRGIAIRDEEGKPIRMLGAHNDMTAIKESQQEAEREKAKLQLANEELQSFVYGVSHDLKSPARTANQLIVEALHDSDNLSDIQKRFLANACDTLQRMHSLVDHLLDYGRVVEHDMTWESVDLSAIAEEILSDLKVEIASYDATIQIEGSLPVVKGDRSQLRMLLQNLLSNAMKFRRADISPTILIYSRETAKRVTVSFQDNGIGIDPKHAKKIFNVFSRLHRREEIPGNGLGLALCKRIALNHNGSIDVAPCSDGGSTFTVELEAAR